jgi:deaminated glutathione amidase
MSTFAIAGLQLETAATDNVDSMIDEIDAVHRRYPWVQMVLLGELHAFGPRTQNAEALPSQIERRFCDAARRNRIWLIPGSLYERSGDAVYNTAPVIAPDGSVVCRYRKMYPFLPYEKDVAAGCEPCVFEVPGVARFGVSICYDMWFPEAVRALACQGAEVILHPSLTNTIDRDVELSIARANAAINQCYFFSLNLAPRLGVGRSAVFGPGGEAIHIAGVAREIIPVELDFEYLRRVRRRGWHGLGQTLKSFRDAPFKLGKCLDEGTRSPALRDLGPLEMPSGESGSLPDSDLALRGSRGTR